MRICMYAPKVHEDGSELVLAVDTSYVPRVGEMIRISRESNEGEWDDIYRVVEVEHWYSECRMDSPNLDVETNIVVPPVDVILAPVELRSGFQSYDKEMVVDLIS
jgi:hypothetical protein